MATQLLIQAIALYEGLETQKEAIAYLQTVTPDEILDKFAELWGAIPTHRQTNQAGREIITTMPVSNF